MTAVPFATWLGIAAAAIIYLAASLYSVVTLPWKGTYDAYAHIDYVYQVHHRSIPASHGYAYRKVPPSYFNVPNPDKNPQWASSHPPFFYAVASLVMGEDLDRGQWQTAVLRGRLLNVFFGLCCILALAWAGWVFGGVRGPILSVLLPSAVACMPTFIRFSAEVYNDVLVTLFSIIALTLCGVIIKNGISWRRIALLVVVCMCGLGVKATFVFAFVLSLATVFVSILSSRWHGGRWHGALWAALATAFMLVLSVLPSFWFYFLNYQRSGSWARSAGKFAIGSRQQKTLADVLSDDRYWLLVPRELLGPPWSDFWTQSQTLSLLIFLASLLLACFLAFRSGWVKRLCRIELPAYAWLLLVAHFVGLMFAQLDHAVGWGQYSMRYFLPALLSIGLLLAGPLSFYPTVARLATPALTALMAVATVVYSMTYLDRVYSKLAEEGSSWARLFAAVEGNGLSFGWVLGTVALAGIGMSLQTIAIFKLSRIMASRD